MLKGNPLKIISLGGLILTLALASLLVFFTLSRNPDIFPRNLQNTFLLELRNYNTALELERPELLSQRLDRLEKRARTQEEWLSVLKRRRDLAETDDQFLPHYQNSAGNALKAFPHSEAMITIAGDSQIQDPSYTGKVSLLRNYAGRISQPHNAIIALSLYALAGDLKNPSLAQAIPGIEKLLAAELPLELKELIQIDEILLGIFRGETAETTIKINELFRTSPPTRQTATGTESAIYGSPNSGKLLSLAGEFFYDYSNPLRAAELFAGLGDSFLSRTADALALAGEIPAARNIWMALSTTPSPELPNDQVRSLYNLAVNSATEREAAFWLEKINNSPGASDETMRIFEVILYSRFQNSSRAIAFLTENGKDPLLKENTKNPLLQLEILRRRMETIPLERLTAEVWLLLGEHPDEENLYQWGAWYFDWQKLYLETAELINIASQRRFSAPWLDLTRSLALIREGNIDQGLAILEEQFKKNPLGGWRYPANIARVQESYGSVSAALANYEIAAELSKNPRDTSLLQLRISRCLENLGRREESRQALELALHLDPDNFEAKLLYRNLDR